MFSPKYLRQLEQAAANYTSMIDFANRQTAGYASMQRQLSEYISKINQAYFSIRIPDIFPSLQINVADLNKAIEVSTAVFDISKSITVMNDNWSKQIRFMTGQLPVITREITANFAAMKLAAFDLSSSGVFAKLIRIHQYHIDSIEAFNAANWPIAPSMSREFVNHVVFLYQQKKTRYISNAVLGYYHRNNHEILIAMVEKWKNHPLFLPRMHIINDALKAHCEGRYTLSVPALLPHIEGILNEYVIANNLSAKLGKVNEVCKAVIGEFNGETLSNQAIADTLLYQLQTNTYSFTNFETEFRKSANNRHTTRHTVLHGITTNYNKPIHSLRVFVLLDALSSLQEFETQTT